MFSFEFIQATLQECCICNVVLTLFPNIVDCGQVSQFCKNVICYCNVVMYVTMSCKLHFLICLNTGTTSCLQEYCVGEGEWLPL